MSTTNKYTKKSESNYLELLLENHNCGFNWRNCWCTKDASGRTLAEREANVQVSQSVGNVKSTNYTKIALIATAVIAVVVIGYFVFIRK